jgi:hypothetical protein
MSSGVSLSPRSFFLLSLQSFSLDSSPVSSLQRPLFPETFAEIDYKSARSIGIDEGFRTLVSKSKSDLSFKSYNVFPPLISHSFFPHSLYLDALKRCASFMGLQPWLIRILPRSSTRDIQNMYFCAAGPSFRSIINNSLA